MTNKKSKNRRKRKLEEEESPSEPVKKFAVTDANGMNGKQECDEEKPTSECDFLLPTREVYAEQLLVSLRRGQLVIVEGDIGCGKTYLVAWATRQLARHLTIMQIGDQIDAKSLLGAYECTEVAGQFRWKPSLFHKALLVPGVVLLEDIDTANGDVISALVELAASREVALPSGDVLRMHPDSVLVASMLMNRSGGGPKKQSVLEGVPCRVLLPALTNDELLRLAKSLFPRAALIANSLCKIFREIQTVPAGSNSRRLTSTDFVRACARLNDLAELSSNENVLAELLDVWCVAEPSHSRRLDIAMKAAGVLSLSKDQVVAALTMRMPSLTVEDRVVRVGRSVLDRFVSIGSTRTQKLGETRDALQLLERMAVCVHSREPVLLVGESGVGKTSMVQALADMLGHKLRAVNLGPHSDPDSLITSLRPTTFSRLMEPFTRDFVALFSETANAAANQKFLSKLEKCLAALAYNDYLAATEETGRRMLTKTADPRWGALVVRARRLRMGLSKGAAPFAEERGAVKEAATEGHWLLIDEINLAPPECLDAIVDAISSHPHPGFRLFAAMNPATDAGKRRLPEGIRSRFTEVYVAETEDEKELARIVSAYLPSVPVSVVSNIVSLHIKAKKRCSSNLRTLCRSLTVAASSPFDTVNRTLYESFALAMLSNLEKDDKEAITSLIAAAFPCPKTAPMAASPSTHVVVQGYAIQRGDDLPRDDQGYVITPTVARNLGELARIVACSKLPVLLEGETSAGKTSIVTHLARVTGNVVLRINNHEHTDVQEYLGTYVPDGAGRLFFREGPLVEAVKKGYWVILDELNLAPTDVIETLNRLLDDNRELFVSEANETIKAHDRFRLFATQNPAGSYAGRKRLSRALLSRFVVLLFPHLPFDELSKMVCTRCKVASSAADRMIAVLSALRLQRSLAGLFSARDGLMTLRDVFRWASRLATDENPVWQESLLHHGVFLLAGRCRNEVDKAVVVSTLESVLKGKIDEQSLFSASSRYFPGHLDTSNLVMTLNMRRMLVLAWQAWLRHEAVLVVGETGEGKTQLAETLGRGTMLTLNCHERTETNDLLGSLRPTEEAGKFAWQDGLVVQAMREGRVLLMDEISLTEDSVLERLNSLFEDKRSVLLTECVDSLVEVHASAGFDLIATMNPGGDYGKKELSKALRNRFTEIWSSASMERSELAELFQRRLPEGMRDTEESRQAGHAVIEWIGAFHAKWIHALRMTASLRDVVACADMYSSLRREARLESSAAVAQSVAAVFIDPLPCHSTRGGVDVREVQRDGEEMLIALLPSSSASSLPSPSPSHPLTLVRTAREISIHPFSLPLGPVPSSTPKGFSLSAPTCVANLHRILRALHISKPILLEGSPGCGKSTGVMALAALAGYPITRLNLSEQTDVSDLFGSDIPIVDEATNEISFRWEDGPVLRAIKKGEWILLDEMNLASQAILESLNACFDFRRRLVIPELGKEWEIPAGNQCRFFACQNPRSQGGNRRALPKSFANRFTNIYTDDLTEADQVAILADANPAMDRDILARMVQVNLSLESSHWTGSPFSFNLRDILRWIELVQETSDMAFAYESVYVARLRVEEERTRAREALREKMGESSSLRPATVSVDEKTLRIGPIAMDRGALPLPPSSSSLRLLPTQSPLLLALTTAAKLGWLTLLVGPRNAGKRSAAQCVAALAGRQIEVLSLSSDTDAQELIGSYEQKVDSTRLPRIVAGIVDRLRGHIDNKKLQQLETADELTIVEREIEVLLAAHPSIDEDVVKDVRRQLLDANKSEMHFAWVDSPFVRAYTEGRWIVIENVNLCNAAVLDRLNTCLEAGGSLVVSERRSTFTPIPPHPDFRVILSMDPADGEISRAMRNRSVEVYVRDEWRWSGRAVDAGAVMGAVSGKEEGASGRLSSVLSSLSPSSLLFSGVLLSEMGEEAVGRIMGRPIDNDEEMETDQSTISLRVPSVRDIVAAAEKRVEWETTTWKAAEMTPSAHPLPLLALLSSSTETLRSTAWTVAFGARGAEMLSRLASLLPSGVVGPHPIDTTFHGDRTATPRTDLVLGSILVWASSLVAAMAEDPRSAARLSRELTTYQLSSCAENFDGIELVTGVDGELRALFEETTKKGAKRRINGDVDSVFPLCMDVLSLLGALREGLSTRTRETRIRIAYERLEQRLNYMESSLLTHSVAAWRLSPTQRAFLEDYAERRLVEPFSARHDAEAFRVGVEIAAKSQYVAQSTSLLALPLLLAKRCTAALSLLRGGVEHGDAEDIPLSSWQSALAALPWRSTDRFTLGSRLALLASPLHLGGSSEDFCAPSSSSTSGEEGERLGEGHGSLTLASLRSTSPVAVVLAAFWERLGWDARMRCISIRHLHTLSLGALTDELWRAGASARRITAAVRDSLSSVLPPSEEDSSLSALALLSLAVGALQRALPPDSAIDPVIFREEERAYLDQQIAVADSLLGTLSAWREIVGGPGERDVDGASGHPLIAALFATREKLREERARLVDGEGEEGRTAWREDARQWRSACSELRSFSALAHSTLGVMEEVAKGGEGRGQEPDRLALAASQARSFATTAATFVQSLPIRFPSLMDVTAGCWMAAWLVLLAARLMTQELERAWTRRRLSSALALPPVLEEGEETWLGHIKDSVVSWSIRSASPMAVSLQAAIVEWRVQRREAGEIELQWTIDQWKKWYEKYVAKETEKEFEYKSKTMEEKDADELDSFFSAEGAAASGVLTSEDLVALLDTYVKKEGVVPFAPSANRLVCAFSFLQSVLGSLSSEADWGSAGLDASLAMIASTTEENVPGRRLDVYRETDKREVRAAMEEMDAVAVATRALLEKWPEIQSLSLILEAIEAFHDGSTADGQMKMAAGLEKILEEAEEWEKLADRANSLEVHLSPLRKRLVEWKQMEIRCWSSLLARVEQDSLERSRLVSLPLFEALYQSEERTLIAMTIDWIGNASLLDYAERITTARLLAEWSTLLSKDSLAAKLRSLAAYFEQFTPGVEGKKKGVREPIEKQLKEFLRIAQYKDLNLLSIKASAAKNHLQLFKMIRKFRDETGMAVGELLDRPVDVAKLLKINEEKTVEHEIPSDASDRVRRASELASKAAEWMAELAGAETWCEMESKSEGVREEVGTRIDYQGEEEEMEKQQGRERLRRQRAVAQLIKDAQELGLNSRRAQTIKGEELNERGLTALPVGEGDRRIALLRAILAERNCLIRKGATPNEQLSTSTRGHMLGMVEYGTHWLLENERSLEQWRGTARQLRETIDGLRVAAENSESCWTPCHVWLHERIDRVAEATAAVVEIVEGMKIRLATAPKEAETSPCPFAAPLAHLHAGSEDMAKVSSIVSDLAALAGRISTATTTVRKEATGGLYPRDAMSAWWDVVGVALEGLRKKTKEEAAYWFEEEAERIQMRVDEIAAAVEPPPATAAAESSSPISIPSEPALLLIQRLYKTSEAASKEDSDIAKARAIDRLAHSAEGLRNAAVEKLVSSLASCLEAARDEGGRMEESGEALALASVAAEMVDDAVGEHARASHAVAVVVYRLAVLGVLLFERGYINTIPKEEKVDGGEGKEESGSGGGMGEGKGGKDVTEEMEETGQIEPLKGEEEEEADGDGDAGTNDRPIEMEEDFAEDIQDVDRDGKDQDEGDDEDNEEEPQMDDQMGDVEDKDDEELDPHLWDDEKEEDKEKEKEMDQDDKGADRETGDLAAREDDAVGAEDQEKKEKEGEEEEDKENVDERDRDEDERRDEEAVKEKDDNKEGEEEADGDNETPDLDMDAPVDEKEEEGEGEKEDGDEEDEKMETDEEVKGDEETEATDEPVNEVQKEEEVATGEEQKEDEEEKDQIEGGSGGEKREDQREDGAGAKDDEEEKGEEEKEDRRQEAGASRRDNDGTEAGEDPNKEESKEEEKGEEETEGPAEKKEQKRNIVQKGEGQHEEVEEEDDLVEDGKAEDDGMQREESGEGSKEMAGSGTLDEARASTRREQKQKEKERKRRKEVDVGEPMEGIEDAEEGEAKEAAIHFAPLDLLELTERVTRDLVVGRDEEEREGAPPEKDDERNEQRTVNGEEQWKKMAPSVALLASELAENLRLILEPRLATRMQGDYRTGKRLNMKRIIPYIASEYRKNRIWMRRSKLADRNYQVMIAVDDSASMQENGIEQVTCEGVCIVEEALRRVGAGQLSVIRFGETSREIIPFEGGPGGDATGAFVLSSLTFGQSSTDLCGMLRSAAASFDRVKSDKSEQMLIILSDGRGALAQGVEKVKAALSGLGSVAVLFLVLDCGSKSIADLTVASFAGGKVTLVPYLSMFPFPLYVLAKNIQQVPSMLAEALRQWIELGVGWK